VTWRTLAAAAALCVALAPGTAKAQKFAGLATTPPLGWNSWNHFGCNVSEIRNLWTHKPLGSTKTDLLLKIPTHDVVMLRLSP
jgi:hypothetical protein